MSNEHKPTVKVSYQKKEGFYHLLKEHTEEVSSLNRLYEIIATCFEAPWFYDQDGNMISDTQARDILGDSSV